MKDYLGQELREGDTVIVSAESHGAFYIARIEGFTAQYVKLNDMKYQFKDSNSYNRPHKREPQRMTKIDLIVNNLENENR